MVSAVLFEFFEFFVVKKHIETEATRGAHTVDLLILFFREEPAD